ncbi:MAG: lipoate--protein ligase family protein, partial [Clostridia bacterium]
LVSGMILVSQDPVATTRQIEELYRLGGEPHALRPEAVTNLEQLLNRPVAMEEVESALRAGFASMYDLQPSVLDQGEWERATGLYAARQLGSGEVR